ncbi:MAG: hypothetical protein AB1730_02065 [Myxococcota bacterium]
MAALPANAQNKAATSPDELDKDVAIIPFKNGEAYKGGHLV